MAYNKTHDRTMVFFPSQSNVSLNAPLCALCRTEMSFICASFSPSALFSDPDKRYNVLESKGGGVSRG